MNITKLFKSISIEDKRKVVKIILDRVKKEGIPQGQEQKYEDLKQWYYKSLK